MIRGSDDLAPGLLGLRSGVAPLTAQDCSVPSSEQWFTGVGAGADHDSVIELDVGDPWGFGGTFGDDDAIEAAKLAIRREKVSRQSSQ